MKIAFHLGAYATDEDRLLKTLLRNRDTLSRAGITVPGPRMYRKSIREALISGRRGLLHRTPDMTDEVCEDLTAQRMILSHPGILGVPNRVLERGVLHDLAARRITALCEMFPGHTYEFYLALRNPAAYVPGVFAKTKDLTAAQFAADVDLEALHWSDLVERILSLDLPLDLTVWCHEDTPLIWGDILRDLADVSYGAPIVGEYDLLESLLTDEGRAHFHRYIEKHAPDSPRQKQRVAAAFLERFGRPEEMEEEIDFPGLSADRIDRITRAYEADFDRICTMPGVTTILP